MFPLALVLALGLVVGAAVAAAYGLYGVRPLLILDDPAAVLRAPWYVGAVNALGVISWCVAATASLLAAAATRSRQTDTSRFLFAFGALTIVLMLDDQYMFHERIGRFDLGIPERVTLLVYVLLALSVAVRHGRLVLRHPDAVVLYCAVWLFGVSLFIDVFDLGSIKGLTAAEEYSKFLGILCWALFASRASLRLIREELGDVDESTLDAVPSSSVETKDEPVAAAEPRTR